MVLTIAAGPGNWKVEYSIIPADTDSKTVVLHSLHYVMPPLYDGDEPCYSDDMMLILGAIQLSRFEKLTWYTHQQQTLLTQPEPTDDSCWLDKVTNGWADFDTKTD